MTTNMDRRALLLAAAALAAGASAPAFAEEGWPKGRQLRLVVPFPPGGATDVVGRIVADKLGQIWGQTIVVENRAGAGGNIGNEVVAKAEPNGDTLLVGTVGMATNQFLYPKLNYDPVGDFAPISLLAMVPNLLVVSKGLPVNSVQELIAYAKANPGKLNYGSSGVGTSIHLSGELFQRMTGTKMVHVPYRGSAQATQDLIAGRLDLMFDNISQALPHAKAGSTKALAITTGKRSPVTPEYETVSATVPGFDVSSWFAFFMHRKTPPAILDKVAAATRAAVADPGVQERLKATGAIPVGGAPEELEAFMASEVKTWGAVIKEANIKAD
ncbi:tripartite tricarboxylate transporter substrate binding protein [Alsobacter soli]|nr:tripartite tricarboxylate transporter substrate binding protein [Alsobacter soli]